MRYLLAGLVLFLMAAEVFSWDMSLATGMSAKNAILYVIAVFLLFRIALTRDFTLEAVGIHACFVVLITYAIVTWLIAGLIVEYPGYDMIDTAIRLKSSLVDYFIFFLVFFHGCRTERDALTVLKALLLATVFANVMTVGDVAGIIDLGFEERADGRAQGALGESNQYGAFIILFLPGLIAAAVQSRGLWRLFWVGSVLISAVALIMTVSRGAFVGLLVAAACGAWLYGRWLSPAKVAPWVIGAVVVLTLAMTTFQYVDVLQERVFSQTRSIDLSDASSGRTEIWSGLLERMLASPWTFLTGFGWGAYWTMPFRYSPHNHYLSLWFNVGLPGLVCGVMALAYAVRSAKLASDRADPPLRPYLIAFVIGALAVCVAVFFVELYQPWLYFWAYVGVAMRLAVSVPSEAAQPEAAAAMRGPQRPTRVQDAHGWAAQPRARAR